MPGCFGRRKKKTKKDNEPAAEAQHYANSGSQHHGNQVTVELDMANPLPQRQQQQQQQQQLHQKQQQQLEQPEQLITKEAAPQQQQQQPKQAQPDEAAAVTEAITVLRSQSMHQSAPRPGNIKKAATMSRYDFLRKQENINYADRWATLKLRYLEMPKQEAAEPVGTVEPRPLKRPPPRLAVAQSLPRQFSPPSTVVSPVKFSNWFLERQAREAEARRESHTREQRMLKIIEGPSTSEMEEAAVKIQAGYKGYKTRKEINANKEMAHASP